MADPAMHCQVMGGASLLGRFGRQLWTALLALALAALLVVPALVVANIFLGPGASAIQAAHLGLEIWWILIAAAAATCWQGRSASAHLWHATIVRRRRRIVAATAGGTAGVALLLVVATIGWSAFQRGDASWATANTLDLVARWAGIIASLAVSLAAMPRGRPGLVQPTALPPRA